MSLAQHYCLWQTKLWQWVISISLTCKLQHFHCKSLTGSWSMNHWTRCHLSLFSLTRVWESRFQSPERSETVAEAKSRTCFIPERRENLWLIGLIYWLLLSLLFRSAFLLKILCPALFLRKWSVKTCKVCQRNLLILLLSQIWKRIWSIGWWHMQFP